MLSDDVVHVLVMLLSGLRCVGPMRKRDLGWDFAFFAVAAFFSSLFLLLFAFSLSFLSFSSFLSCLRFIDCSDVNTRENVVGMPTRRCEAGAGLQRSGGGVKMDDIGSAGAGREETREADDDESNNITEA